MHKIIDVVVKREPSGTGTGRVHIHQRNYNRHELILLITLFKFLSWVAQYTKYLSKVVLALYSHYFNIYHACVTC